MVARRFFAITAVTLALIAGCIVSDEVSTLTIRPDGSADWIKFRSNIRSTEAGEKGAEELRKFIEAFEAHEDPDYRRIAEVGGEVVESRWLREDEPCSTVLVARLPGPKVLEDFCTIRGGEDEFTTRARFTSEGRRRRLSIVVSVPVGRRGETAEPRTALQLRQEQASGISETRVAVVGGEITGARGFTLARDRRSALLEPDVIRRLTGAGDDEVELFLEWELTSD